MTPGAGRRVPSGPGATATATAPPAAPSKGRSPASSLAPILAQILAPILALLLILTLSVGPLVLGGRVRDAYRDLLGSALETLPVGWVVLEHYDRGWLGSTASAELVFRPEPWPDRRPERGADQAARIRIDSRIDQGPLAWLSALPRPVLARIRTRIEWAGTAVPLPPLHIDTRLLADGSATARFRLPPGEQPGADGAYRVRNGAGTGTLRYAPGRLRLDLQLPDIALIAPAPSPSAGTPPEAAPAVVLASLRGARADCDLRPWIGGLYAGTGRMELAALRIATGADPDPTAPPTATPGPGPDPSPATPPGTAIDGLAIQLDQTPRGTLLDLSLDLTAQRLRLGTPDYRDARLRLAARSLDGETLAELIAARRALSAATASPPLRALVGATLIARLLPRLAAGQPRIGLDPLALDTPDGPVRGRLTLGVGPGDPSPARTPSQTPDPTAWLRNLAGEGELALPRPVALDWLARTAPADPGGPQARLDRWAAEGWIAERDGRIDARFRLADGQLAVNGKPIPFLAAPTGPATGPKTDL